MTGQDAQNWLPAVLAFASFVGVIVTLRNNQRHTDTRLNKIEKSLEHITPRAAQVEGLHIELEETKRGLARCREVLIQHGWMVPEDAPRYPRAATPIPTE